MSFRDSSFRVSGKNLHVGEALRGRVSERIAEAMGKYFDGGYSGHATLEREGFGFRTECAVHLDSRVTLQAEGMAADAYASADQAALRIEKRLRRYHRRLKDHRPERVNGRGGEPALAAAEAPREAETDGFTPVIIADSTTALKQLSVREAASILDMTGAPVVVFRHARHGGINVVYRRPDGHFGWVNPQIGLSALSTQAH
jgi:ribosomal subunit interface protein